MGNINQGVTMKSSIFILFFLLLFAIEIDVSEYNVIRTVAVAGAQTPCVNCDNQTTEECQRVNTPTGPHIYYGNRSDCEPDPDPGSS